MGLGWPDGRGALEHWFLVLELAYFFCFVNHSLIVSELLRVASCCFRNDVKPIHEPGQCVALFLCFCTILSEDVGANIFPMLHAGYAVAHRLTKW